MAEETFQKLFAELRSKSLREANNAERKLRAKYKELLSDLQGFLAKGYAELAKDGKLSVSVLQQKGKYARFLDECTKTLGGITPDITAEIQRVVDKTYEVTYKGMVGAVDKAKDLPSLEEELKSVRATTPSVVKKAVENPISKLTLSDTLENKRHEITYNIRKQVSIGLVNGDRYETMAKRIADTLDGDYKKAIRIARTEAHKVREQGLNDAAVDCSDAISKGKSGLVMTKTWRTGKDARVRDTHARMEGVTVLADEEFELPSGATTLSPGDSGVASEDINCRCYCSYKLMTIEEYEKASGNRYTGLGKKEEVFGVSKMNVPQRPNKEDYGGLTDEYYAAREKYRKEKEAYDNKIQSVVDKNLNRPHIFKTSDEVHSWADKVGIKLSDDALSDLDLRVFDDVKPTLEEMFEKYPFLKKDKRMYIDEEIETIFTIGRDRSFGTLMEARGGLNLGSSFDDMKYALKISLDQVASGYNVNGDGTIRTIIRHECGHNVQGHLYYNTFKYGYTDKESLELRKKFESELIALKDCEGVSKYALTNTDEFFAEGFAEYTSGSKTEFAVKFGKLLNKYLR